MGCSWWLFTNIPQKIILGGQHPRTKNAKEKGLESLVTITLYAPYHKKLFRKILISCYEVYESFQEDTISGYSKSIHL